MKNTILIGIEAGHLPEALAGRAGFAYLDLDHRPEMNSAVLLGCGWAERGAPATRRA
jgi:hypothetical protein